MANDDLVKKILNGAGAIHPQRTIEKILQDLESLNKALDDLERRLKEVEMQDEKQLDLLGAMLHEGEI